MDHSGNFPATHPVTTWRPPSKWKWPLPRSNLKKELKVFWKEGKLLEAQRSENNGPSTILEQRRWWATPLKLETSPRHMMAGVKVASYPLLLISFPGDFLAMTHKVSHDHGDRSKWYMARMETVAQRNASQLWTCLPSALTNWPLVGSHVHQIVYKNSAHRVIMRWKRNDVDIPSRSFAPLCSLAILRWEVGTDHGTNGRSSEINAAKRTWVNGPL